MYRTHACRSALPVEDATNYRQRARRIIEQFAGYTVLDSATHVTAS